MKPFLLFLVMTGSLLAIGYGAHRDSPRIVVSAALVFLATVTIPLSGWRWIAALIARPWDKLGPVLFAFEGVPATEILATLVLGLLALFIMIVLLGAALALLDKLFGASS